MRSNCVQLLSKKGHLLDVILPTKSNNYYVTVFELGLLQFRQCCVNELRISERSGGAPELGMDFHSQSF